MILFNQKQVTIKELEKLIGITIPIDKILKKPLFEINPAFVVKDPANGQYASRYRNSMEFPSWFRTKLKSGEDVEIRYATNVTPDTKTEGRTMKFSPRSLNFDGKAEFIGDDEDKAIYFWLHFYNEQSPFRKTGITFEYTFVDDGAKADKMIKDMALKSEAMAHASKLSGNNLIITAKGMDIQGVAAMEPAMVKAQLLQVALDRPGEYLNKAKSTVNHIRGLIIDSIDKGIFVMENIYNMKTWKWAMGVKVGEVIVEYSSTVQDDNTALITHISQHINEFMPVLIDMSKTLNAKANLEAAAKDIDVFALLNDVADIPAATINTNIQYDDIHHNIQEDDILDDDEDLPTIVLPTTFEEAKVFLGEHIGKKTPALASELFKGISDGSITEYNIQTLLEDFKTR